MSDRIAPPHRRYMRASSVTAAVMQIVSPHIIADHQDRLRDVADDLLRLFLESGAEFIDDSVRAEAGLAPRDGRGWTAVELAAYENRMTMAMLQPLAPVILQRDPKDG